MASKQQTKRKLPLKTHLNKCTYLIILINAIKSFRLQDTFVLKSCI